jgi:tetratricopeptide (TPR) repeat protein
MAFNKAKTLEAAQKLLNQGKVPQAILEYQKILRVEPKDQVALMTIGDLYVRSGDHQQAIDSFETLAKIFIADGFITKGIAIYKKIAKLIPDATHPLERLAELYVQQGVMSEARPIFLQLAEAHMKTGKQDQSAQVLRKLLDLEPDNLRVQIKLAELQQSIGQPAEAARTYLMAAQRHLEQNDAAEARKMAERAQKLDAKNPRVAFVLARAMAMGGALPDAVKVLEGMADGGGVEGGKLLGDLYLKTGQRDKAMALARKLFSANAQQFGVAFQVAMAQLDGGEPEAALQLIDEIRNAMLEAGDSERVVQALKAATERLPGKLDPLEWLVDVYRRTNDSFRLPEALDQLAEAAVAGGNLPRAKEIFEELLEREPQDETNKRRLNQVRQKLGLELLEEVPSTSVTHATQEVVLPHAIDLGEAPPPLAPEVPLDEETQKFVNQALTDVDLFSSYGLAQKAIDLLESVLQRAPRHVATLERLLDLHLGAGNDRRTAEIAGQLEQIYREHDEVSSAEKFAELRRRFQKVAGVTAGELAAAPPPAAAPAEFTIPGMEAPAPVEVEAQPAEEATVQEVDLSSEWAAMALGSAPAAEAPPAPEPAPEVIELSMEETPAAAEAPAVEEAPAAEEAPVEYEIEMTPAAPAAPPEPAPAAAGPMTADQLFSDLGAEIDDLQLGPAPAAAEAAAPAAPPPQAAAGAPKGESVEQLREVFEEFRAELGEMGAEQAEDLETHYNLGIAYREMGLLEEAIGEFQKVAKEIQAGRQFRYAMQCCTLLGLTFMDKGQPKIAAMWYERALKTQGLDQESILALRYDLGMAQELAGEAKAALDSFQQVYAMNIDYRDVADRIAALQQAK